MSLPRGTGVGTPRLGALLNRPEFLAVARGARASSPGINLQGLKRGDGSDEIRVGFTASKKVGGAVVRNRAKRRMRALARQVLPATGRPGWDYVLVARADATVDRPFDDLRADLVAALARVHR